MQRLKHSVGFKLTVLTVFLLSISGCSTKLPSLCPLTPLPVPKVMEYDDVRTAQQAVHFMGEDNTQLKICREVIISHNKTLVGK